MNTKIAFVLKRVGVFLVLLFAGFSILAGLLVLYLRFGVFWFGLTDATAVAETWFDEDGDGTRDLGEPPLAGVCIWADTRLSAYSEQWLVQKCAAEYSYGLSDASGHWPSTDNRIPFFAGGDCSNIYVYAVPPPGYYATTPLVVNNCEAQFGFNTRGGGMAYPFTVARPEETVAALQRRQVLETGLRVAAVIAVPLAIIAGAAFAAVKLVRK